MAEIKIGVVIRNTSLPKPKTIMLDQTFESEGAALDFARAYDYRPHVTAGYSFVGFDLYEGDKQTLSIRGQKFGKRMLKGE